MYKYSDFTVLIALNYTNKAQTEKNKKNKTKNKKNHKKTERRDRTKSCPPLSATVTEIAKLELGSEAIHSIALRPNSAFSIILQEKKGWLLS